MPKCIDCGNRFPKKKLDDAGLCESCAAKREKIRLEEERKEAEKRKRLEEERKRKEEEERRLEEECKRLEEEERKRQEEEERKHQEEERARKAALHERHQVAGVKYHEDELRRILVENPVYSYTKRELIDGGYTDERIYQYELGSGILELQKEPDNPHDPKAIKVIIDGEHVGYIKSGSCAHIAKLIDNDRIASASVFLGGGKYKILESDYDWERDRDVYQMRTGEHAFFLDLNLELKPLEP